MTRNRTALAVVISGLCSVAWDGMSAATPRSMRMEATAFAQSAKPTAAGTVPHDGIAASDPAILPLGTRIRVTGAGAYNGVYIVTDTGSKVNGRHIDLCLPSAEEARQFGKKTVSVRVIKLGEGKQDARDKDIPARTGGR